MRKLAGIIAATTGTAAFTSWLLTIWSNQTGQWLYTALLLSLTAWISAMVASEI